jgi:hypothetical protein
MANSTPVRYDPHVGSVLEALSAPDRTIRHLIEDCGASWSDLLDVGLTDYTARKRLRLASPRPLAPAQAVPVPPVGLPDTVAFVPMNDALGRRYLRHGVYIRDAQLHGQIRLRATHLGWSDNGRIEVVRPITRRWRIGSAAAIAATTVANAASITSEPDLTATWPGPAALVELGPPIAVGLPLGFAPNPTGGASALPGVRHALLADLLAVARRGGTLVGVPTI